MVGTDTLEYHDIRLHKSSRRVVINNSDVRLRNKEFTLLEFFMNNVGIVLSRARLLEEVWDQNICCSTNTVDVHVSSLRKVLKKSSKKDFIKTVYCVGYIFEF